MRSVVAAARQHVSVSQCPQRVDDWSDATLAALAPPKRARRTLRIVQLNLRDGSLLSANRTAHSSMTGVDGSASGCTPSHARAWLQSMHADVAVLFEASGATNASLLAAARSYGHNSAWLGHARSGYHIGVTCRSCRVLHTELIGAGRWGRDIEFPVAYRHAAYALYIDFGALAGRVVLIAAQLDAQKCDFRVREALALLNFYQYHRLHQVPTLLAVGDAGAARSDAPYYERTVRRTARNESLGMSTGLVCGGSDGYSPLFGATDAFAAELDDIGSKVSPV